MVEHNSTFPWQGFSLWLKDGILAATIVNKFMNASWPEEKRSDKQLLGIMPEERQFLTVAKDKAPQEYRGSIEEASGKLSGVSIYPEISEEQAGQLWEALTAYCATSGNFNSIRADLKLFLQSAASDPDAFVSILAEHILGSLGPATAQDERMLTHG
jgi:hypothetical protein